MDLSVEAVRNIGGAVAGAGAIFAACRKPARYVMRLLRTLSENQAKLDIISAQLEKNAGKSMRDSVDRIEASIVAIDSRTAQMSAVQSAQIDGADHGIVFADLSGKLTRANRTFRRWTGKEPAELAGDGWMKTIHPDDLFPVTSGWSEAVRRGIDYLPAMPITYLDPEGEPFRARVTARLIREDGKVLFYWCEIWRVE